MVSMKYKSSEERTQDYIKRFNSDSVLTSLVNTDEPIIFDVGANVGQTLDKFKKLWPESIIHCFEPITEFYNTLLKNSLKYDEVSCHNFAFGDKDLENVKFYYHEVQPMLSGVYQLNPNSKDSVAINEPDLAGLKEGDFMKNANKEITVKQHKLDTFVGYWDIPKIDILKLDTQCSEAKILKGAEETLEKTSVVLTELNFYDLYTRNLSFYDIEQYLNPAGFKLYDISYISKNPLNGRTDWVDVIYTK